MEKSKMYRQSVHFAFLGIRNYYLGIEAINAPHLDKKQSS